MKTILACVDFSAVEENVLSVASSLAAAFQGDLHVLHVADPEPAFVDYGVGPKSVRDRVAAELREQHRRVEAIVAAASQRGVTAHPHTLRGPYVETILGEAEHVHADVIVLGSHGRGRLQTLFVGNVAEGVLRGAHVPVVVVPLPAARTKPGAGPSR